MRICVYGLSHLGSVTAACLAEAGFDTVGVDDDERTVSRLAKGTPTVFEPGLDELIKAGLAARKLSFSTDVNRQVAQADLTWVAFDTPLDEEDRADVEFVTHRIEQTFPHLRDRATVLVSSQLPVGSTRRLEQAFLTQSNGRRRVSFVYSPENLRLGHAIENFRKPERIIAGIRDQNARTLLAPIFSKFTDVVIWVSVESAEMTKHALNTYLAASVTFINEIAAICEHVGANVAELEIALRSDPRIGQRAYIKPGTAFAGGTLARDVNFLGQVARANGLDLPLLASILPSNKAHREWPMRHLMDRVGCLAGKRIGILGLTYKPGTDSLRRSEAVELCCRLKAADATVLAYDPVVKTVESDLAKVLTLSSSAEDTAENADALIVGTEWPQFKRLSVSEIVRRMRKALVIDPNRFLDKGFATDSRVDYVTIGKPL
jgi:UDPglucose 6-dehydrogenase